jgi:hypothetical protein
MKTNKKCKIKIACSITECNGACWGINKYKKAALCVIFKHVDHTNKYKLIKQKIIVLTYA